MEMHLADEVCVNCGREGTRAIRLNGPMSMTVWCLPLIPTGARIDAWLCIDCLGELAPPKEVNLALVPVGPSHKSAVQKALAKTRKEKKHHESVCLRG